MADPRVFYDPKTGKIVKTDPPGLMKLIREVPGTTFVHILERLYDLAKRFRMVSVQSSCVESKPERS